MFWKFFSSSLLVLNQWQTAPNLKSRQDSIFDMFNTSSAVFEKKLVYLKPLSFDTICELASWFFVLLKDQWSSCQSDFGSTLFVFCFVTGNIPPLSLLTSQTTSGAPVKVVEEDLNELRTPLLHREWWNHIALKFLNDGFDIRKW